jgi:cytochrome c-type biogenesis protein
MKLRKETTSWLAFLSGVAIAIIIGNRACELLLPLETIVAESERSYQNIFTNFDRPYLLLPLAFGGGAIASISPCILSLLPVNLSYIGTLHPKSRFHALRNAVQFVLGAIAVFSILGLSTSIASTILVDWRGYINIAVGAFICLMAANLAGWFPLPQWQHPYLSACKHPFVVGASFALVTSPCASPVLFAILAAAATTGSPLWSTLTAIAYACGYTMVIFAASLGAGLVAISRSFLPYAKIVSRSSIFLLAIMGGYYLVTGIIWFL